jgi:hypothetical protein
LSFHRARQFLSQKVELFLNNLLFLFVLI